MTTREKYQKYANLIGADLAEKRLNNFFDRVIRKELSPKQTVDLLSLKGKVKAIICNLNDSTGKRFSPQSYPTHQLIAARLAEGFTVDDFLAVHSAKCAEWKDTQAEKYLRPDTLYTRTNFHKYIDNIRASQPVDKAEKEQEHGW